MVRIQIEKALPYSSDEFTSDFEIIEKGESESVVSAIAVHNGRLDEIAAPLLSRGLHSKPGDGICRAARCDARG